MFACSFMDSENNLYMQKLLNLTFWYGMRFDDAACAVCIDSCIWGAVANCGWEKKFKLLRKQRNREKKLHKVTICGILWSTGCNSHMNMNKSLMSLLLLLQQVSQSHVQHFWCHLFQTGHGHSAGPPSVPQQSLQVPGASSRQTQPHHPSAPWQPQAQRTKTAQGYCKMEHPIKRGTYQLYRVSWMK